MVQLGRALIHMSRVDIVQQKAHPSRPIMRAPPTVGIWLTQSVTTTISRSLAAKYRRILSNDERSRYWAIKNRAARFEYLVGRALVRTCLSEHEPISPNEWRFRTNAYGRPEVSHSCTARRIKFNLTHSRGLIACITALDRQVGIDVEYIRAIGTEERIAARFFSPHELRQITDAPPEARCALFWSFWVLKESYIKANGLGLAMPLASFSFDLQPNRARVLLANPNTTDRRKWRFALFSPSPRVLLGLTIEDSPPSSSRLTIKTGVPLRQFDSASYRPLLVSA